MRWILALLMIFFIACSHNSEIVSQEITGSTVVEVEEPEEPEETLSCDKVICNNNFTCVEGKCVCKGIICGNECVIDGCCTDEDCSNDEQCVNQECVQDKTCEYNQVFDEDEGKCICEEDYFFCEEQGKCLIGGSCCHQGDCDRYSICVNTVWAASICFQYPNKKLCRTLRDIRPNEVVNTPEGEFFVTLEGIFSEGFSKIKIEDEVYTLGIDQRISAAKGTVWLEDIKVYGGTCKVKED